MRIGSPKAWPIPGHPRIGDLTKYRSLDTHEDYLLHSADAPSAIGKLATGEPSRGSKLLAQSETLIDRPLKGRIG